MTSNTSLIITVLNERNSIEAWLQALLQLTELPQELVVCDGGSTDGTREVIQEWARTSPFPVRIIREPGANISRGRNIAFHHAVGPWVAVTDAGTTVDPRWLEALIQRRPGFDVVAGFFYPSGSATFERILAAMITPRVDEIAEEKFLPSSRSLLVLKSSWQHVGGYPEWLDYCEDLVFDLDLKRAGFKFTFAPDALVSWTARASIRSFFMQYYRYGRGDGKAGLWPRRHAVRYAIYLCGVVLLAIAPLLGWWVLGVLALGIVVYHFRYYRRIMRAGLSFFEKSVGLCLAAAIGSIGDVAKMIGYPAGVSWRRSQRGGVAFSEQCEVATRSRGTA